MNEFRRVLRYLVPVFVFTLYTFLFSTIALCATRQFESMLSSFKFDSGLLIALIPGLGFIFSTIHHVLYNSSSEWVVRRYPRPNYTAYFTDLKMRRILDIKDGAQGVKTDIELWCYINVIWHRLRVDDPAFDKVNERNDSLTDLVHSTGTTYVAFWFSIVASLFIMWYAVSYCAPAIYFEYMGFTTALGFAYFAHKLHRRSYLSSVATLESFIKIALFDALSRQTSKSSRKNAQSKKVFQLNIPAL